MAAAEARAVWQRTANRYFVQEDAKRAPKLACCPSSSSSSLSKQIDTMPANATDEHENSAPPHCISSYSNLSPDSKWWLQLQSYNIDQRGLTNEQVNTMEARDSHQFVENFYEDVQKDLKSLDIMGCQSTPKGDNLGEESYNFVEMDSADCCTGSKELDEFSLESKFPHWMGSEKNNELPWWQMTDKDDLASFVAQRSQYFIENCDLPQPLSTSIKRDCCQDKNFTTFESWEPQRVECQNATMVQNAISGDRSKPISSESGEIDWSKGKVLEAIRHCQTRAREAEKAAKEAYAEREEVVKLIFKQASQLFAYKQWLHLLQLENLYYYHMKKQPWEVPLKARKQKKKIGRNGEGKYGFVMALGLGLGLVGAGMVIGWTVGWMLQIS